MGYVFFQAVNPMKGKYLSGDITIQQQITDPKSSFGRASTQ